MTHQTFSFGILAGAAGAVIVLTTACLIDKILQHDDEIEELFSRIEECESSHELEK